MLARLKISGDAFDLSWNGTPAGDRRALDDGAVAFLHETAERYRALLAGRPDPAGLLALGRALFRWVDGDRRQLTQLFEQATPPLVFEVEGPPRPSPAASALLHAPWEILADDSGFWAEDALLRFCPLRRLGPARPVPPVDDFRLGLVFMAAAPRGQHPLDYDGEEAAIRRC